MNSKQLHNDYRELIFIVFFNFSGSAQGPLRSSLKKTKQKDKNLDTGSTRSSTSSKQVRISLGAEQTQVWTSLNKFKQVSTMSFYKLKISIYLGVIDQLHTQENRKKRGKLLEFRQVNLKNYEKFCIQKEFYMVFVWCCAN